MTQTLPDTELFTDAQVFAAIAAAMGHHGLDARSIEINNLSPILVCINVPGPEHVKAWADTFGVDMTTNNTKTSDHYEARIQIAGREVTVSHIIVGAAYGAAYTKATDELHAKLDALDEVPDAAAVLETVVDDLAPDVDEVTCGRCAIAVGAHTFGRGCNAQLVSPPVFLGPSGTPKHAARPELLHVVGPEDVAPGEPDDRGWDAPIKPTYVDELGASA